MKKIAILNLLAWAVMFSSCGGDQTAAGGKSEGGKEENKELTGKIRIDGSSTVYPVSGGIAEEFNKVEPKVKVIVNKSGSGSGFKMFYSNEIEISDASRGIKDKEKAKCAENGVEYVELTVAYDGLAVLVHPENDWITNMTVEELKKLWEPEAEGKVMLWSDLNPDYPAEKISLYGPGTASGTFDYFTEAIVGKSGAIRSDYSPSEDDDVLVHGIAGDKYAIGFFGLAYYENNKDKLKLVGVDAGKGAIIPTLETVGNGTYAPLSRPLFIYVSKASAQKPEVDKFVNFYLENAAEVSQLVGYIPLPAEEYTAELKKFNDFKVAKK